MILLDQVFYDLYINEIGQRKHSELETVDKLFENIVYKNETRVQDLKDISKIENKLSKIFDTKINIELKYRSSDNVSVIPILKKNALEKKYLKVSDCETIFIDINFNFFEQNKLKGSEMTAIILHEFGHVENSLTANIHVMHSKISKMRYIQNKLNRIPIVNTIILPLLIITTRSSNFVNHIREFHADNFAIQHGYGDELMNAIIKMDKYQKSKKQIKDSSDLYNKLHKMLNNILNFLFGSTHPADEKRIKKIANQIIENYSNEYGDKRIKALLKKYYEV